MSLNKLLAALLAILFVICGLVVILGWTVENDILDADSYVASLDEAGFFEVPYQLIRDGEIPGVGGLILKEGPLSVVSGPRLEAVARELAPPIWLRTQVERGIRDIVAVAQNPESNGLPSLVISLREVKARALGEPGDRALSMVVDALPVCAPGRAPIDLDLDTPVCKPSDTDLNPLLSRLKSLLNPLVARIPDTYRVSWQPEQADVLVDLQQAGQTLTRLKFVFLLLAALNLALLGLTWLLAVRSPAEWLRWTGLPLLLLGLLTLLIAQSIPRVVAWGLDNQVLWSEQAVPQPLAFALEAAIRDFSWSVFRPTFMLSLIVAGVGLLLVVVSPLFPGRRRGMPSVSVGPVA